MSRTTTPASPRHRFCFPSAIALVLLFVLCRSGAGQGVSVASFSGSVPLQRSTWRVARGDNPDWKNVTFDDSKWISFNPSLPSKNPFQCIGFCWFRQQVSVPPQETGISIALNNVDTSYEVFINGQKIGGHGQMPPHASNYQSNLTLYPVPNDQLATGKLLVAIRIWVSKVRASDEQAGGVHPSSVILLGKTSELEVFREQDVATTTYGEMPPLMNGFLGLVIGIPALFLFRSQRDRREYMWLFGQGTFLAICVFVGSLGSFDRLSIPTILAIAPAALTGYYICNVEFIFAFIGRPVSKFFRFVEWSFGPFTAIYILYSFDCIPRIFADAAFVLSSLPFSIGIPILLILAYRRGNREAGLLLIPIACLELGSYAYFFWNVLALIVPATRNHPIPVLHIGPVRLIIAQAFAYVTWLTVGVIILLRNNAIVRERGRAAAELQAAKAVQDVLMPKLLATTPGFTMNSAYRPAQEVGGDFFHVLPLPDGSLRVVIGDVSGKGLKAAMTVALLIGALDRETGTSPAHVLNSLNRILTQHSTGGFATCLCAHITPDGTLTAANAGHFAPFQNGHEAPMEGNLPLGLDPEANYTETSWPISAGDRLVLFTDGVLEARHRSTGELFGFERTTALIAGNHSAEHIADTAQSFGQDDDITVVEIMVANAA